MQGNFKATSYKFLAGALLVPALILLLLPFLSYPGDYETLMKIRFREVGTPAAQTFTLPESEVVCSEISLAMSDRDLATGAYTKVAC